MMKIRTDLVSAFSHPRLEDLGVFLQEVVLLVTIPVEEEEERL